MVNLIIGFVLGFFIATNGVMGVAVMLDKAVKTVQETNVHIETNKQ